MAAPMQRCPKCGTDKPRTAAQFHKDPANRHGFKLTCRECTNAAARAAYAADPQKTLTRLRERRSTRAAMFATHPSYEAA
ncbi:hypothetical protein ACFW95_34505 [Streptomyces sp. NPDC059474]|uniref:hypothetical protein n=1 Tax=Streptomyces sp. NPDC059474 TaxID=3346846 RepID=UPI0036C2DEA8